MTTDLRRQKGEPLPDWLSFHIYYHRGDRDDLLSSAVRPLVEELLFSRSLVSFFFVRYSLGGPHVRLRLLPSRGAASAIREAVSRVTGAFLHLHPSPSALPSEEIARFNQRLLCLDPNEHDGEIYPDNSCHETDFVPETERYGGSALLPASLAFFALSSVRALQLIADRPANSPPVWLASALGLLRRFTLGFATCAEDLLDLTRTPSVANADVTAVIEAKADGLFARQYDSFRAALEHDLAAEPRASQFGNDISIAAGLRREVAAAEPATRRRLLTSHLHMSLNRLGLRNSDEVYLARLLHGWFARLAERAPGDWSELDRTIQARPAAYPLQEELPKAFGALISDRQPTGYS